MIHQLEERILIGATLAVLIGMNVFFSRIDRELRGADSEAVIKVQSDPIDNNVVRLPRIAPNSPLYPE